MAESSERSGVLFVMPSFRSRTATIDARWVAGGRFAEAVGRAFGGTDVLTPYGLFRPEDVAAWAVSDEAGSSQGRRALRRLPRSSRVLLGDLRAWRRARQMRTLAESVAREPCRLVIQFHRRFQDCGALVARRVGAPFVLRIEALEVREEAAWGIRRKGWGRVVERVGEHRVIRQADLVAPVSPALDVQLAEAGVPAERRVVIPNGVDLEDFSPGEPVTDLRRKHHLGGRFVVGWVGGFRPFHGLEFLPEIARGLRDRVPGATLCLLGTGPLRRQVAEQLHSFGETVRLLDPVPHAEVPRWIRTFDACLLLAAPGPFHYSPLKLYEYLGCGRPVVAVGVGEVGSVLSPGRDALLVPLEDPRAVVDAIERLARDPLLRTRLGAEGRATAERCGSWDARAATLLEALEGRGLLRRNEGATAPL